MKLTLAGLFAGLALASPLAAGSPARSYQEARQVLDAGIKAMGGLDALREIKDVSREAKRNRPRYSSGLIILGGRWGNA